ncbi:hypothetical protein STAFG_5878 [Streptomyces afghaniensis 772]|uniref:Uncharacterized protein n=1 Tax=Streptomyces afghaniensis 772 TaxID=1283301 RepID=S4MTW5_9ACTN|nr:hypothetical protein STAFG_5878 [Streptomyces afghaniensis 772]
MTTTAQRHLLLTMTAHESPGSAGKTTSSSRLAEASARI